MNLVVKVGIPRRANRYKEYHCVAILDEYLMEGGYNIAFLI